MKVEAKMRAPVCPECHKPMEADSAEGHDIWACEDGHPTVWDFRADPEQAGGPERTLKCVVRFSWDNGAESDVLEEQTFYVENVPAGGEAAAEAALYAGVEHLARGMRRHLEASDG